MHSLVEAPTVSIKHRPWLRLEQAVAASLFVVLIMWEVLANPTVNNAVVSFIFAGIVPGSHRVLTPNSVIYGVIGILGCGAALLIGNALRHSSQAERLLVAKDVPKLQVSAKRREPWGWYVRLSTEAHRAPAEISLLQSRLSIAYQQIRHYSLVILLLSIDISINLIARLRKFMILIWKHLEPRLRQLDSWLGQQLNKQLAAGSQKIQRHHNAVFMLQLIGQMKAVGLRPHFRVHADGSRRWSKRRKVTI